MRLSRLRKIVVGIFLVGVILMALSPMLRRLIYFPQPTQNPVIKFIESQGFTAWDDKGYLRVPKNPKQLVVIFHGNAGNAADRFYMASGFMNDETLVYLHEYPGYGDRQGKPSEESIIQAAHEDVEALQKTYPTLPLILMGESLGTGVASGVAEKINPKTLILIAPFSSLTDAGKYHYPWLPVSLLLPDTYDSMTRLTEVKSPLLILHGTEDNIVPYALGEKLYQAYLGPKKMVSLPGYGHNNLPWDDLNSSLWTEVSAWMLQ